MAIQNPVTIMGEDSSGNSSAIKVDSNGNLISDVAGVWGTQTFTGANEASGTFQSLEIPAGATEVLVQWNDAGSSVLTRLALSIGDWTAVTAEAQCDAIIAAAGISNGFEIGLNDELAVSFAASAAATIVGFKSTGADSGANTVIISWKVPS